MSVLEENSEKLADTLLEWYISQVQKTPYLKDICNQLVRSATSIGANVAESKFAQSDADYKSKMNIALKEANETKYWINRLYHVDIIDNEFKKNLFDILDVIIRILISLCKK